MWSLLWPPTNLSEKTRSIKGLRDFERTLVPTSDPATLSSFQKAIIGSLMSLRFGSSRENAVKLQPDLPGSDASSRTDQDNTASLDVYRDVLGPTFAKNTRKNPRSEI
jgi:hypothetical protein